MIVFVLTMVLRPEVQSKGRQLMDRIVGRETVPILEDRPQLRYIHYVVQETPRWCPVSPIGVAHRSLHDDVLTGYFIPAGSVVYANARAMTQDERIYQNPEDFDPECYIPVNEGGRGEPFPTGQFEFGRRICVGKHLVEANMKIITAALLSMTTFEKVRDSGGNEVRESRTIVASNWPFAVAAGGHVPILVVVWGGAIYNLKKLLLPPPAQTWSLLHEDRAHRSCPLQLGRSQEVQDMFVRTDIRSNTSRGARRDSRT